MAAFICVIVASLNVAGAVGAAVCAVASRTPIVVFNDAPAPAAALSWRKLLRFIAPPL